jgi:signal transduction histidine kinase
VVGTPADSATCFTVVTPTDVLDDRTFDRQLLNQLAPLYRRLRDEPLPLDASDVVVDLRRLRSLYPYAALGLLVLLETLAAAFERRVKLMVPAYTDTPECVKWIAESGFVQAAALWADVVPLPFNGALPVRDDPYIIPIRTIRTRENHLDLIEELLNKVPYLLGHALSHAACMRIITVFSELCQNVLYYSSEGSEPRGYAMLQAFKGIVKFAVADSGYGIPSRIRTKYEASITPWSDSAAISLALKAGVTTRPSGGGLGLYHVRETVSRHNGILNVRSGSGKVLLSRGQEFLYEAKGIYRGPMFFWGTQVGIVLERP